MEGILRPGPGLLARLRALLAGGPEEGEAPLIPDAARALRRHGDAVLRLACSYLHQRPEAEDVLQDTLLQYLQKAPPFSGEEHERAWLLRVAANLCKNRLSYWKRHPQEELSDLLPGRAPEPELLAVWDAVGALPARYRGVIHLYYYEGYTTVEIARILGARESTVRSLLARGREKLRVVLKEGYDFEE